MYSAEELTLAQWAVKSTSPDSIWLTGTQHNHWLYNLTGRQPLMAFPGWLWTHGYDYLPVQNHLRTMFQYPERYDLFQRYGIEYVVIGWQEKSEYNANLRGYEARYPLVQKTEAYSIFDVTQPPKVTNLLPEAGL